MSVVTTCRRLLIVGGGFENEARLRHAAIFDWHAVDFVARRIKSGLRGIVDGDARFTFAEREVTEEDIQRSDIVFEDCGDHALAEQVTAWCRKHNVPLNATDKAELCDLYYTSFLIREPLIVSVSSGGDAPAISAVLRRWLERKISPGWSTAARLLAETRQRLPRGHARMDLLRRLARDVDFLAFLELDNEAGMRKVVDDELCRLQIGNVGSSAPGRSAE
jgi:uroporphyrin-III C-methyltransferase/precorrin-2 dehydrogenase/sirohydrochlorin ferrochelatase